MCLITLLRLRLSHLGANDRSKNQHCRQAYNDPAESISHFKSLLEFFECRFPHRSRVRALLGARAIRRAEHTLDNNDGQGHRRRETGKFQI